MTTGGITITAARWNGPSSLTILFTTTHFGRRHQAYYGRRLAGETRSVSGAGEIVIQATPSRYPEHLWIVAIDDSESGIDQGSSLPPRPYNTIRVKFDNESWSGDDYETDVRMFQLFAGEEPNGDVDYSDPHDTVLAVGSRAYQMRSRPLGPSGSWSVGVQSTDTTEAGGNAGTAVETTRDIISYPPDMDASPQLSVSGGVVSVMCGIPGD